MSGGLSVMFPGQSTQRVGMGWWMVRASAASAAVFESASDIVGYDVRRLCLEGPRDRLTNTEFAQPAVFTCNAAAYELLLQGGLQPEYVIGHSVGEFNALCAAGVLDFETALALVNQRARLMGTVARPGSMSTIVGLTVEEIDRCCGEARSAGQVVPALFNAPDSTVVSGDRAAVERCAELARAAGAKRVVSLVVSHAFHSPHMEEVIESWRALVADTPFRAPTVPVACNTSGGILQDVESLKEAAVRQLVDPVRWIDCVRAAAGEQVTGLVEAGDSKVLCSLARGIVPDKPTWTLADPGQYKRLCRTVLA